jgi:carboxymethylenebutenolidase
MNRMLFAIAVVALAACGQDAPPSAAAAESAAVATAAGQHAHDTPTASPALGLAPRAPVLEREVAYGEAKTRNLVGFLAMPADAAEPLPGLIVIHEWWGLDDNVKAMARRLAGEGYVALAVDLYGGETAETPDSAQQLMKGVVEDPDAARANLRQAYEYLEKYAFAPRIGSIGWALGGGWSLQAAMDMPDQLDATVMYYGQIVNDPKLLAPLGMPILGLFGALDESIPASDVLAFRKTLSELGKSSKILLYPRASHAFANPSGGNYNAEAAEASWQEVVTFLEASLKTPASDRQN